MIGPDQKIKLAVIVCDKRPSTIVIAQVQCHHVHGYCPEVSTMYLDLAIGLPWPLNHICPTINHYAVSQTYKQTRNRKTMISIWGEGNKTRDETYNGT